MLTRLSPTLWGHSILDETLFLCLFFLDKPTVDDHSTVFLRTGL